MPIFFILFLAYFNLEAQEKASTDNRAFNFYYANDVAGQTDKYYTNGIRFDLTMPVFSQSPFSLRWVTWKEGTTSYHTINFSYDVFTPDLHLDLYSDRPFAAVMTLGSRHQYIIAGDKLMLTSALQFGMMGQVAGAGKMQNGIHKILPGSDSVAGWETQIRNDIVLNYIFSLDKQVHRSDFAEIIFGGTAYLGTPYTKFEVHTQLRLGIMADYFNRLNIAPQRGWQAYIYGDITGAYIAHNATLEGGLINPTNPYVRSDVVPFVLDLEFGIGLSYEKYTITYGQHWITPEFSGAAPYSWAEINFMVTF